MRSDVCVCVMCDLRLLASISAVWAHMTSTSSRLFDVDGTTPPGSGCAPPASERASGSMMNYNDNEDDDDDDDCDRLTTYGSVPINPLDCFSFFFILCDSHPLGRFSSLSA